MAAHDKTRLIGRLLLFSGFREIAQVVSPDPSPPQYSSEATEFTLTNSPGSTLGSGFSRDAFFYESDKRIVTEVTPTK